MKLPALRLKPAEAGPRESAQRLQRDQVPHVRRQRPQHRRQRDEQARYRKYPPIAEYVADAPPLRQRQELRQDRRAGIDREMQVREFQVPQHVNGEKRRRYGDRKLHQRKKDREPDGIRFPQPLPPVVTHG